VGNLSGGVVSLAPEAWHYVVAYAFAMLAPQIPRWSIRSIGDELWRSVGGVAADRKTNLPALLGFIEGGLYTTAYLIHHGEFIGAWLILKVAGGWKGWQEGFGQRPNKIHGRALSQIFLIGTGLNLAYGLTGGLLVGWVGHGMYGVAAGVAAALVILTIAIREWAGSLKVNAELAD
jgi:hypothetical protein